MTDGTKNKIPWLACQHAKQKFGKPYCTGIRFACQTLAFFALHLIDRKSKYEFFNNKFPLLFYLVMFVSVTGKAQTIHTFYIDSTHTTSNWNPPPQPQPSDTSFTVSNGDTLYFINHLYTNMFNIRINDPNLTGAAPTMSTWPVNVNDTIIRFAVVNDTTYHILGYNNVFYSSISQFPNIVILDGTAGWGRRYFITHNSTSSISESDWVNNLSIYPVPANNFLNVNGIKENQTHFYLFDLSGKLIKKGLLNNGSIDIQFLDSGTYFIKFSGMEKIYKFIKN